MDENSFPCFENVTGEVTIRSNTMTNSEPWELYLRGQAYTFSVVCVIVNYLNVSICPYRNKRVVDYAQFQESDDAGECSSYISKNLCIARI